MVKAFSLRSHRAKGSFMASCESGKILVWDNPLCWWRRTPNRFIRPVLACTVGILMCAPEMLSAGALLGLPCSAPTNSLDMVNGQTITELVPLPADRRAVLLAIVLLLTFTGFVRLALWRNLADHYGTPKGVRRVILNPLNDALSGDMLRFHGDRSDCEWFSEIISTRPSVWTLVNTIAIPLRA